MRSLARLLGVIAVCAAGLAHGAEPSLGAGDQELRWLVAQRTERNDTQLERLFATGPNPGTVSTLAQLTSLYGRGDLLRHLEPYAGHRSDAVRGAVLQAWANLDARSRQLVLARCLTDRSVLVRRSCYRLVAAYPDRRHEGQLTYHVLSGDHYAIEPLAAISGPALIEQLRTGELSVRPPNRALLCWTLLRRPDFGTTEQRAWLEAELLRSMVPILESDAMRSEQGGSHELADPWSRPDDTPPEPTRSHADPNRSAADGSTDR